MKNHLLVYQVLETAASKWQNNFAIHDDIGSLTFGELFEETHKLKIKLIEFGIKSGMAVGIKACNGRHFTMLLFAVAGCGATAMPIYHQLKNSEIENIIQEAQLQVILDDKSSPSFYNNADAEIKLNKGIIQFNFTKISLHNIFATHVINPVFMRFTSGTTGKSKGVILSHKTVIDRINAANKALQLGPNDTVVWVLPMAYHFIVSIVLYIKFGTAIAIAKNFLAKNIIEITNKYKGTLLYASPLQIRLLSNDTSNVNLPSLEKIISTSGAIASDVCSAFKKRFGKNVSQAYGIIEIGLPIINFNKSDEYPNAVGFALPDNEVAILDENYNPLPNGTVGLLGIKGLGMFDAYLLPPIKSDEILKNGYFITADYATQSKDGMIIIEGRAKSVINISGIKIFPEEVEIVLESIPEIKQARVFGTPHPLMGQIIEAEIVLNENTEIDVENVILFCRKRLSNFKAPQKIKIVKEMQTTNTGKIKR